MKLKKQHWFLAFQFVVFAFLLTLSVIFYHERLLADSGYYLMRVINSRLPWIEHGRFILFFSQVLPVIGVNLQLPLKVVLLLYSLNHVLFPLLIFLVAIFYFKNQMAGVLLILLQVAALTEGFIVPMFELYYAASLLVLFIAILYTDRHSAGIKITLLILTFFIFSSHPMGIVLLLLVVGFYAIDRKWQGLWLYLQTGILLTGFLILKYFTASEYETGKTGVIIQDVLSGKYDGEFFVQLTGFLLKYFYSVALIAVMVVYLMTSRKWFKALIFYLAGIVVVIVLSALNSNVIELSRYNEQVWFPLIFVVAFPFMTGLSEKINKSVAWILSLLFILLVFSRLILITERCLFYKQRTDLIVRLNTHAQGLEGKRFVIDEYNIADTLIPGANWSYPIESMLFSAESGHENTVTICTLEDYTYKDLYRKVTGSDFIFWRINTEPYSWLNPHYFRLNSSPYMQLNQILVEFPSTDSLVGKVRLVPEQEASFIQQPGKIIRVWTNIETEKGVTLYSNRSNGLYMTYEWEGAEGKTNIKTSLRVDVSGEFRQDVIVQAPEKLGDYSLVLLLKSKSGEILAKSRAENYTIK